MTIFRKILRKICNLYQKWCDNFSYGQRGSGSRITKPMRIVGKKRIFLGNDVGILNAARIETIRSWAGKELNGKLIIGDRTSIGQCCHLIAADQVEIGSDCVFSAFVYISDCSHQYDPEQNIMASPLVRERIKIGNHVFIGIGSCIMPGVNIGDNAVVGANSVVTKSIPAGCMVAGSPARVIKKWTGKEWQTI